MYKTDDFIKRRLLWKAGTYKLPTKSSFYYDVLSKEIQKYLGDHIQIEGSGQPVLFFTKPTNEWTLVCTRQVICNNNKTVFRINIEDIDQLKPTALQSPSDGRVIEMSASRKTQWHQVTIIDKQNKIYILHADKGPDLFALWNILLMASRLYKR